MKTAVAIAIAILLLQVTPASAQLWWFENRTYYEPLIAGVRDPNISALALASATRMEFMIDQQSPHRVWDIDLGAELPVFGWESQLAAGDDSVGVHQYGVGLWIPIDFHMIEDFVDESAPIVNNDYRFGVMVKAQYRPSRDASVSMRLHAGHESTHLGDEFSINGQRRFPTTFERINVSWEYLDLGLLYRRHFGPLWSIRGGVTATLPFHDTYYIVGPGSVTQSARGPVTESKNWFDPYAGYEQLWHREHNDLRYDVYVSAELRWRSVYDYHKRSANDSEERQPSINLIAGAKKRGTGMLGRVSPFVRFYRGVNPHGQFRNQKDYTELGIGLRLVR